MRNRQFVFTPKIEYKLVAERGEANQNSLTFPFWCSILELVRTHFSGKIPPRKFGKAVEPHRSKPQKNPEKNIGSNHILILGEENFLILTLRNLLIFMKVLIIDNGTSYLNQLQSLLPLGTSHTTIAFSEIDKDTTENFDVAILSGGHSFPVVGNENRLGKEIDFVKNYQKPIFGICFGFELIASAFGAKLEQMEKKEHGILDIEVIEPDDIFLNTPNFSVYESHRWVVREPGEQFITLAKSKDGVEVIKHKTRPIYAVQFHPEMFIDKTCGDEIFHNFLNLIK